MSLINQTELKRQIQTGEPTSLDNTADEFKNILRDVSFKLPAKKSYPVILVIKNIVSNLKTILIIQIIAMGIIKKH